MGGTAVLIIAAAWLQQHYLLRLETKLAITTSSRFVWHILRLPIDFFYQRHTADISVRIGINDRIARLLSGELATNLLNVILILFYTVVMIQYDVLLTAIGVLMTILNIVTLRLVSRWRIDANQRLLNEQGKFISTAYSGLQMIETLKASGSEGDFFARWAGYQANSTNAEQELGLSTELLTAVPAILSTINIATILMVGGLRITTGALSIGELIAFQSLVTAFLLPVNQLVNLGNRLQQTEADMVRMDDVLRYPVDESVGGETAVTNPITSTKLSGFLTLKNITYGYSRLDDALISDFNLSLKPGARVALVGSSGSGKSTVARLVAGVHQAWEGEILFDGKPRIQIPPTQLKNSVTMVDQEIHLFMGSVRQNITMWDETIPEAQMVQAARDAAIHEDIAGRAGGYEYQVAEGGGNFSGGQRQRLEIARALAHNPTILVMDEATSALDPITEKMIDDNLRRRGCTCLIVAHRLSTIRDCDEILVLEKGRVVQRGTHEQMIHVDGPYARLIKADHATRSEASNVLDLL
jgi:NHLM bacteriocin system ABC transporter peptidase/ATP-binding protein